MSNPQDSDHEPFSIFNQALKLDTEADIIPHLAPLRASQNVTSIHLGGNTFGVPACQYLASILRKKPTLRTAILADIFTSRLLSEIPPALSSILTALLPLQNLHTVDLSDNAFGFNTQAPLVAFLEKHTPLQHLILNNNGLGPNAGVLIADALTALAAHKAEIHGDGGDVPHLETIVCGRNRLESGSMAAWAKAFRAHKRIRSVKMVQNGIRQEGIAVLLRDGLRGCAELRTLDLQDNTFTSVGAQALAEVVGGWSELLELGIGDCLVGARGAAQVADALGKGGNAKLRVLRAQYNEIDAKAVAALLKAAKTGLKSLRRLELNGNKFSEDDEAIESLRSLLEERKDDAAAATKEGERAETEQDAEWGLDDLSDLEEESDEEDDEDGEEKPEVLDSEEETELKAEAILKDAEQAEQAQVAQRKDEDVDALADRLGKTGI